MARRADRAAARESEPAFTMKPESRIRSADLKIEHRGKARSRVVLGVFGDLQKAGSAMLALEERGFAPEDITLRLSKESRDAIEGRRVFRDQSGRTFVARVPIPLRKESRWREGVGLGAVAGGAVGAWVTAVVAAWVGAGVGLSVIFLPACCDCRKNQTPIPIATAAAAPMPTKRPVLDAGSGAGRRGCGDG